MGVDVNARSEEKLGIGRDPYVIPGACNPPPARRSLDAEPEFGVPLPCNVVVYGKGGSTREAAATMLSAVGNEDLGPIAQRVHEDSHVESSGWREVEQVPC